MIKVFTLFVLIIAVLQYGETFAQDKDLNSKKEKKEDIKVDTRIDNMGYWKHMIKLGKAQTNAPIPVKPGEYKGSMITAKGIKAQDSPDVPVSSLTNVAETENSIFIDPTDNQFVLNSNNSTSWSGGSVGTLYGSNYFWSNDGSTTWAGSEYGAGGTNSGDPTTAINLNGTRMYVGYIDASYGMGVSYSTDGGASFTPVNVAGGGYLLDKNHMWIDNSPTSSYEGNLYNSWTNLQGGANDGEIELYRSTDGGLSWINEGVLSTAVSAGSHNQGVNIQTGPNGEVYVVWTVYDSWPSDETALALATSTDGGNNFGASTRIINNIKGIRNTGVSKNMRVNSFPSMAVDISGGTNNGNMYLVWTNVGVPGVNSGTNLSVYMSRSTDGGATWSTAIRVNDGPNDPGKEAYFPWITCDPSTGTIAVVYYDDRDVSSTDCEAWVSYSVDAGNNWTSMRVSDVSFTPSAIPGLASGYFGDYLGITSKDGVVYPCWTDNRDAGRPMTYVSPFVIGLNAAFSSDLTTVCTGSTVTFTDQSSGSPTSWNWSFPGGTPSTATGSGPHTITYNTANSYQVSLTVGDGTSTDTETIPNYITVENIIADFSGSPTTVVVGNTVTFTDNSSCSPTSWNWTFDGGSPGTATGAGPHTVTYNTTGTYDVTLYVANASYNNTEFKGGYIDVINCNYCATSFSNTSDDYISNVTFNTINNPSGSATYSDFTGISTNITTGNTYNISVDITVNGSWLQYGRVWIDWNRDCDFDDTGEAFDVGITPNSAGTHTLSTNITVPGTASLGSTRMRVSERYTQYPGPCDISTYGEPEDYTVIIQSNASPPIADFTADDTTPAVSQTVNFTDLTANTPTSWSWSFNPTTVTYVGGTNSGSQNPQVQFNASGYYTITLLATNAMGSDSEIKTNYILAGTAGNWTGLISTDWNTSGNWENLTVPTSTDDVTIPASAPNWPTYTGDFVLGAQCLNISMNGSSEMTITGDMTINSGNAFTCVNNSILKVVGDWTNNGSFNPGTGTVELMGSNNSLLTGPPAPGVFFYDGFESNLGWNLSGEFERAAPAGLGGEHGNPDPTSAYAGSNVLGVDLSGQGTYPGDYENNLVDRAYQAVSPTINCTGFTNISMSFQRWLGVESPSYDHAYIDISNDNGNNWTQIWTNTAAIQESSWGLQTIDISSYADNQSQVKIMFSIGSSDGSWQYCGWNIDEFELTGDGSGGETFHNLTINKNNAEALTSGDININGDLTVKPGAYFTNNSGNTIDVNGNTYFEADDTGMASYIDNGTTTVGGNTFVEQYLTSQRWHLVSPPVAGGTINTYYDIYLKEYNEPTDDWTYLVTPTTMPMNQGQGYSAWASDSYTGTTTVTYTGYLDNSDIVFSNLDYTPASAMTGFNLLGNPYPCALNWNSSWSTTDISGWAVIYDNGTHRGWHPTLGGWQGKTDGIIPSTQGFWVRAITASAQVTIPASERVHDGQAFYKESIESIYPELRLTSEINGFTDEAVVLFHPDGTNGFDGYYDLAKFENVPEAPSIYTINTEGDYAFNILPEEYENVIVPVGFKTESAGLYTITSSTVSNFDENVNVYLEDLKTNEFKELQEDVQHSFTYDPLDEEHRFNLHFTYEYLVLEETTISGLDIYSFGQVVYIKNPDLINAEVTIYNVMGNVVITSTLQETQLKTIPVNLNTGYYFVKIHNGNNMISEKVFIK